MHPNTSKFFLYRGKYLKQGFSNKLPCGPWRAKETSKTADQGPHKHHFPLCFCVFWNWPRAKHQGLAGLFWSVDRHLPAGRHLRTPDLKYFKTFYFWINSNKSLYQNWSQSSWDYQVSFIVSEYALTKKIYWFNCNDKTKTNLITCKSY